MAVVAEFIKQVVENIDDDNALAAIRDEVYTFTAKYPMYE
jgi:glycine/serine hydroxymethyltransferase